MPDQVQWRNMLLNEVYPAELYPCKRDCYSETDEHDDKLEHIGVHIGPKATEKDMR
jgi:hypothetical protein